MTREYGAAVYLGGVVTTAEMKSDPLLPADYFLDNHCRRCRCCVRACPVRMFDGKSPDFLLFDNELRQYARRRNIDLCHTSCFGLHSLSDDKAFSNWGLHWISPWVDRKPPAKRKYVLRRDMFKRGLTTGDSKPRFDVLRRLCFSLWPDKTFDDIPSLENFPADEQERFSILSRLINRIGVKGIDGYPISVMCGHCAIICGPDPEETKRRFRMLTQSGLVVPGPGGKMVRTTNFEEARKIRRDYPLEISFWKKLRDAVRTIIYWHWHYFGFELKSRRQYGTYKKVLKKKLHE